jgi:SAM-dependent methyltransferase
VSVLAKWEVLRTSFRALGGWETTRAALAQLLAYKPERDDEFDRRFRTDTSGSISVGSLDIEDAGARRAAVFYVSAPIRLTRYMLAELEIDYGEFDFVDFGCGKGRVLMVASEFPFRSVRGVEISRALCDIAEKNLRVFRSPRQRCFDLEVRCMDARDCPLPQGNTVFHLYHPFQLEVLRPVLQNIAGAFRASRKRALVVYLWSAVPSLFPVFQEYGFERLRHARTANPRYQFAFFSFAPASTAGGAIGNARSVVV